MNLFFFGNLPVIVTSVLLRLLLEEGRLQTETSSELVSALHDLLLTLARVQLRAATVRGVANICRPALLSHSVCKLQIRTM